MRKACTSALGVVVAAAAPEQCSRNFAGLIQVSISSFHLVTLYSFTITSPFIIFFLLKDITLLSDPEKLDLVISSGSQKRLGISIIQNEDMMLRAASFGSRPCEHMHPCYENPMNDSGLRSSAFG